MKRRIYTAATLVLLLCCITTGCKKAPQMPGGNQYNLYTVSPTDRTIESNYSATIRGRQDIEIYPQVSGTLTKLCVKEGERVKKGQTLFIIDQVPYIAALKTADANVEAAEASYATAELTYKSRQELYKENVISEFDLTTALNSMLSAKAQLAQTKAQQLNAQNNLSYTVVKSPSDGVAGTLPYREGALVSPSIPEPLTTISDNSDMYIYFSMTENQLLSLLRQYGTKEEAIKQMPTIKLELNDGSIYNEAGKIETISGVIDQSTGTVSLRAVFPNKQGFLHSGGVGNVIVPVERKGCLVIPQTATFEIQDKVYAYKVVDGKAKSTIIEVSRVNGGQEYIVENGLQAGDVIVAEGVGILREGTEVTPKTTTNAPAANQSKEDKQ